MATNGIASTDSLYVNAAALLATTPCEILTQTAVPSGTAGYAPSLRAEVPADGIYRARGYFRDLNGNIGSNYDGVRVIVSANG